MNKIFILFFLTNVFSLVAMEEQPIPMQTGEQQPKRKISEISERPEKEKEKEHVPQCPIPTKRRKIAIKNVLPLKELAIQKFSEFAAEQENLPQLLESIPAEELQQEIKSHFQQPLSYEETRLHNARSALEVENLLILGVDPNIKDRAGRTALNALIDKGYLDAAFRLLELKGIYLDVGSPDNYGVTPLQRAIQYQDPQLVDLIYTILLSQNKGNPQAFHGIVFGESLDQQSAITLARKYMPELMQVFLHDARSKEDIEDLLALGLDPNVKDAAGKTTLNALLSKGNNEAALRLLQLKEDLDVESPDNDEVTPLQRAIQLQNKALLNEITKRLIAKYRTNSNEYFQMHWKFNNQQESALTLAIQYMPEYAKNFIELFKLKGDSLNYLLSIAAIKNANAIPMLLEKGADPNVKNANETTALMLAAQHQPNAIKTLLDANADPNAKTINGFTPLMIASKYQPDAIQPLLAKGVSVNAQDHKGVTALTLAIQYQPKAIQSLLDAGADPNIKNNQGVTALMLAAGHQPNAIKTLLDANADPNAKTINGFTPLMIASKYQPDAIQPLITSGAKLNLQSVSGNTALIYATAVNNNKSVQFLIQAKADVNIKNNEEFTALEYAVRSNNFEAIKMLLEAGAQITPKIIKVANNKPEIQKLLHEYFEKLFTQQ